MPDTKSGIFISSRDIGGAMGACAGLTIAPEVEPWLSNLHRVIGWVGGLCLLGPIYGLRVAVASLIGGEIGAHFGGQIGQSLGGNGAVWRVRFSVELAAANRRC